MKLTLVSLLAVPPNKGPHKLESLLVVPCRHLLMVVGHGYVFRFEHRPTGVDQGPEDTEAYGSDTEMPDAVGMQQQQCQQQQRQCAAGATTSEVSGSPPQQQQQQAASADQQRAPSGTATPSGSTHTPELPSQQQQHGQQQQEQYTSGLLPSFGGLQTGLDDASMSAPPSLRSLSGLLGVGSTPPADDSTGVGDMIQEDSLPGLSGGVGSEQHKRQRVMGQGADDSPLVFRPTPRKQ
jgi:hypothetical protein